MVLTFMWLVLTAVISIDSAGPPTHHWKSGSPSLTNIFDRYGYFPIGYNSINDTVWVLTPYYAYKLIKWTQWQETDLVCPEVCNVWGNSRSGFYQDQHTKTVYYIGVFYVYSFNMITQEWIHYLQIPDGNANSNVAGCITKDIKTNLLWIILPITNEYNIWYYNPSTQKWILYTTMSSSLSTFTQCSVVNDTLYIIELCTLNTWNVCQDSFCIYSLDIADNENKNVIQIVNAVKPPNYATVDTLHSKFYLFSADSHDKGIRIFDVNSNVLSTFTTINNANAMCGTIVYIENKNALYSFFGQYGDFCGNYMNWYYSYNKSKSEQFKESIWYKILIGAFCGVAAVIGCFCIALMLKNIPKQGRNVNNYRRQCSVCEGTGRGAFWGHGNKGVAMLCKNCNGNGYL